MQVFLYLIILKGSCKASQVSESDDSVSGIQIVSPHKLSDKNSSDVIVPGIGNIIMDRASWSGDCQK